VKKIKLTAAPRSHQALVPSSMREDVHLQSIEAGCGPGKDPD
jgi:hypothetical protein